MPDRKLRTSRRFMDKGFLIIFLILLILFRIDIVHAKSKKSPRISNPAKFHPFNKKLFQSGQLKVTRYFMNVPRLTPKLALALYRANRAVLVLFSHQNKDQIMGGYWGNKIKKKVNFNKLVKKNQILVFY